MRTYSDMQREWALDALRELAVASKARSVAAQNASRLSLDDLHATEARLAEARIRAEVMAELLLVSEQREAQLAKGPANAT